eukprot:SAG31_NODE_1446_length_8318_cov_8.573914_1_plen_92_part_00
MSGGPSPDGLVCEQSQILRLFTHQTILRGASSHFSSASTRSGSSILCPRAMLELCSYSRCADAADHGMHAASVENSSVRTDTPYLINLVLI